MTKNKNDTLTTFNFDKQSCEIRLYLKSSKLQNIKYSTFGIEFGFYPYSTNINSDRYRFLPYQEYVDDVVDQKRSSYVEVSESTDKLFGVTLSLLIFLFFAVVNPDELFSVESVVSIIAAYAVGKELWDDFERFLLKATKDWNFKLRPPVNLLQRDHVSTVNSYFDYAREKRNNAVTLLAEWIDLSAQSNSRIIKIVFRKEQIQTEEEGKSLIGVISFDKEIVDEVENNFMLVVKTTFARKILFFTIQKDHFYLIDQGKVGIYQNNTFLPNHQLTRTTLSISRLQLWQRKKVINVKAIA